MTMKTKRSLTALQARAKSAATRHPESRVIVTREVTTGEDGAEVKSRSAELWLYGTVGGYYWGFDSDDVAAALRALGDVDELLVRLHSFGGSAIEGIAIANLLANLPAGVHVRIVVDGLAASAASMIALAGAELIMSPGSQLMVHDAWMVTAGNEAELHAEADWIGKQSRNYAETYAHRAGGTADSWRDIMRANNGDGTWYSAQEAVDAKLAARVDNIASTTTPPPMPTFDDLDDDVELAAAAEWDLEVLLHPAARAALSTWRRPGAPKPPNASAVGSLNPEGGPAMAFTPEQLTTMRTQLGLPETADEATIVSALAEALEERAEDPAPATVATAAPPAGMSIISDDVLTELRTSAAEGAAARKQQREETRDREIAAAVSAGKIAKRQEDHFAKLYDKDPAGTSALLSELAAGLVPVAELGHSDPTVQSSPELAAPAGAAAFLGQLGVSLDAVTKEVS
jgi:ATP-dependent protease ClpP protease subunit